MKVLQLNTIYRSAIIKQATEVIKSGGVIVYPTDTVYGLGCDPFNADAVGKLLKIKQRTGAQGLIVLINSWSQLRLAAKPTPKQITLLKRYWPGPLTVVLPKNQAVPALVTGGHRTMAVRWPKQAFVKELLKVSKCPIVSTSANVSGQPPAHIVSKVVSQFQGKRSQPDLIIDAGRLPDNPPSTIIQFKSRKIEVVRQGALHINEANGQH